MPMKSRFKMKNGIKNDNRGAALIVCIIVLLFVSILATIILYMSGINYRMKKSDYNNKVTFYVSEIPLETMQTNLVVPVSEALNNAYMECNTTYMYDSTSDYNRQKVFYNSFRDNLVDILEDYYSGTSIGATPGTGTDVIVNVLHNLTGVPADHIIVDGTGAYDNNTLGYINYLANLDEISVRSGGSPIYFTNNTVVGSHNEDTYLVVALGDTTGLSTEDILKDFIQLRYEKGDGTPEDLKDRLFYFDDIGVVTVRDSYRSIVTTKVAIHYPSLDVRFAPADPLNPHVNEYTSYNVYQLIGYYDWQKN